MQKVLVARISAEIVEIWEHFVYSTSCTFALGIPVKEFHGTRYQIGLLFLDFMWGVVFTACVVFFSFLWGLLLAGGMTEKDITSLCCLSTFAYIFPTISTVYFLAFAFLAITSFWSKECIITGKIQSLMSSGYVTHVTGTLFRTRNTICWTVRMNILSAFAHSNTVLFSNQLDWTQHDITPGQSHTQCPPHNARERGCKHWPIQAQRERGHKLIPPI